MADELIRLVCGKKRMQISAATPVPAKWCGMLALGANLLIGIHAIAGDVSRGIYALGAAINNPGTPQDERLAGIRTYDFVSGFTMRVFWSDLESSQGVYNF